MFRRGFLLKALKTATFAVVGTVVGVCKLVGAHWTYPGEIRQHLMWGHGVSPYRLQGLDHESLLTMHDSLHTGRPINHIRPVPQMPYVQRPMIQYVPRVQYQQARRRVVQPERRRYPSDLYVYEP